MARAGNRDGRSILNRKKEIEMQSEINSQIVSFACHLDDPRLDGERKAMDRNWIDETGSPTLDGIRLAVALWDQSGTRSCFRGV